MTERGDLEAGRARVGEGSRVGGERGSGGPEVVAGRPAQPIVTGPASGKVLLSFTLPDSSGRPVSLWDYHGRKNVVLFYHHGVGCEACRAYLRELAAERGRLAEEEAVVLAVGPDAPGEYREVAAELREAFPLLSDPEGKALTQPFVQVPGVVVIDRFGQVWAAWAGGPGHRLPRVSEIAQWLALIELQCPECGVPEWPLPA